MKDSRIVLKGGEYTHVEYELRFSRKNDRYCYAAFPCNEDGNLIMFHADSWGGEYIRIKNHLEEYEPPQVVRLVSHRKYRNLIGCECGEYFLDTPDSRGKIICPRCKRQYDADGCVITEEKELKDRFRILREGECA